jgi:hypothetical protein
MFSHAALPCRLLPSLVLAALAGCSTVPQPRSTPGTLASACESAYAAVDQAVAAAGVQDAEDTRVPGFPYLRVNRFLASVRHQLTNADFPAWMDAGLRLDRAARAVEVAQLSAEAQRQLKNQIDALAACGPALRDLDLADPGRRAALSKAAAVPDDYATGLRIAGLYWLTRWPFAWGVQRYQSGVLNTFATRLADLPLDGQVVRYGPATVQPANIAGQVPAALARVQQAGARFLAPDPADVAVVLAAHAPVFEVDEALPEDRIGNLRLAASGKPYVHTGAATVYSRMAFARFGGRVLPQAVYTAWFPARPKTGPLDVLGGEFDAVVWRVTLTEDGAPLVYDSMHACGCYHQFFPTPRLVARPQPVALDEWALVPQRLPEVIPGQRLRLRLASRSHYLVRVTLEPAAGQPSAAAELGGTVRPYALRPDDDLRALTGPTGEVRSLYGPDGMVPGSERGERYLFWPMGVREPGAMRQWGRHATAFIGRRHFDDPALLDRYFTPR